MKTVRVPEVQAEETSADGGHVDDWFKHWTALKWTMERRGA